ncbi:vWA domain-containing protein [Chroococcidiopsis thermalis]|uniref:von Willebrand factor type A n=1 Tax=Chroococcidiopsis thermalis (strain PCC 7203) TaxID=251229 RepID=K9U3Z6_CHRTP|nr:VWA domain-containing protein [Chroococcidiopsis thermalis]AFY89348.1 von Willebrand factor type A [Chroococcidiopsis thermalis PCC 7203]
MLNVAIASHREFLPADAPEQKLFLMLKLRPTKEVSTTRPSTAFTFVIDTSGSMYEIVTGVPQPTGRTYQVDGNYYHEVTGGESKIDIVIESLRQLIHSGKLDRSDRISIVQFDDRASTIIGLTPATEVSKLENAIAKLRNFSGGTRMGLGMHHALNAIADRDMTCRRTLLFTDGQTFDEEQCRDLAKQFATNNIPITALGVGEYNEELLISLSDTTGGRLLHIVPENATGTQVSIADLPKAIAEEFTQAQQEVITNLAMTVKTVKGVKLSRIVRAYPSQAEFPLIQEPYPIGNAAANDETVFILEFAVESRAASRVRIAQLGLTYDVPGQNRRGELPPQNLVLQFVAGSDFAAQVDREVMDYVQQCNIAQLVSEATKVAEQNPLRAEELLETARRMTQRIGNQAMTESLTEAQNELRKTRRISSGTSKTIKMGSKGKTVRIGGDINDVILEDQIRQLSGT